jgi:uroporphyrinogen-III synthase
MTHALTGWGIANTRPLKQAEPLNALIRQAGGQVFDFPLLEITSLKDYEAFDAQISALSGFDMALVVSVNAVEYALPRILKNLGHIPAHLQWIGMGPSTRAALEAYGIRNILTPAKRFDSEALLDLPEMQAVAGKKILILRGLGGRDLIANTLQSRGAEIIFGECYQRLNPQQDANMLRKLAQHQQLDALVVTSSEALRNLLTLTDNGRAAWLKTCVLCTSHERITAQAAEFDLCAITATEIGDEAMLNCLIKALNKAK